MKNIKKNFIVILVIGIVVMLWGFNQASNISNKVRFTDTCTGWKCNPKATETQEQDFNTYIVFGIIGLGASVASFVYKYIATKKLKENNVNLLNRYEVRLKNLKKDFKDKTIKETEYKDKKEKIISDMKQKIEFNDILISRANELLQDNLITEEESKIITN